MFVVNFIPITLLVLPILNCIFIFFFKRWLGPIGTFINSLTSLAFFVIMAFSQLLNNFWNANYVFIDLGRWFFCLNWFDSHLVFCFDILGLISASLVALLTMLALHFGVEYMYREAFLNRLLYLLNLFATSVILLFFCYDLFLILIIWECIGLFSLLLVNFYSSRIYTMKAALKTFIFSRLSDLFMFLFFMFSVLIFKSTDVSLILIQAPFLLFHGFQISFFFIHFLSLYSLCLALSGVIKSAQFFFHVWLPDAMEAPTPASALIHSSTLVVAGVFLIMRFGIIFEFTPLTNYFLAILGSITLAFASITATFQNDIKKLVAYSTISQIGYLVCGCGFLCFEESFIYLCIHALNKAFLFILVGYIVHFFNGNTDLRQMGSLITYSFDISVLLLGVSLNLFGLPYSAGFIGKEFLIFQFFLNDWISLFIRICWFTSFIFTPIYMLMLIYLVIFGPKKGLPHTYYLKGLEHAPLVFATRYSFKKLSLAYMQISPVTSQITSIVLFFFWLGLFYFGEFFLNLFLDLNSPITVFNNVNFFWIKSFFFSELGIFSGTTLNYLNYSILFFIFFVVNWFNFNRFESFYHSHSYRLSYWIFFLLNILFLL